MRAMLLLPLWAMGGEAARLTDAVSVTDSAVYGDVSSVIPVVSSSAVCVITGRAACVNNISSAMLVDTGLAVLETWVQASLLSASTFSGSEEGVVSPIPKMETRPQAQEADLGAGLPPDSPSGSLMPGELRYFRARRG